MKRLGFPLSLLAVTCTLSQNADDAAPADPAFKVTGMKCFSDKIINKAEVGKDGFKFQAGFSVGSTGPGSELEDFTFPEDQLKQYFEFQFGPGSAGKTITANVMAAKTTMGINVQVIEVSGKTDKEGKLPAEWSLKKNWPVGLYKVLFTSEGQSVGTAGYLVKAKEDRESPIEATGVTIFSVKEGKNTVKEQLTPQDNDLVFKCATAGAHTKGAKVRMFLGQIDASGEKKLVPDSEVVVEEWPLEDTDLLYSFELPNAFPVGDYHLVIFINDELLTAHPFTVAE